MLDTAKVGAQFASPFHQPQFSFVLVEFICSFQVGIRPPASLFGEPEKKTSGRGSAEKEEHDKQAGYDQWPAQRRHVDHHQEL